MPYVIATIESNEEMQVKQTDTIATVAWSSTSHLEHDIELMVTLEDPYRPRMTVEMQQDTQHHAAMLAFHPHFDLAQRPNLEVVIAMDCSGSMAGGRMQTMKRAVLLLLGEINGRKDLAFNVVKFGTRARWLFPAARPARDAMAIAADICIYTNDNVTVEGL